MRSGECIAYWIIYWRERASVRHGLAVVLTGFGCVFQSDARVLILGSMPGQASLDHTQYYAHPRNSFWYIMEQLFDAGWNRPYQQRLSTLLQHRIALWDVVHQCIRKGSLDAAIDNKSIVANDFQSLFNQCPDLHHVFFNGQKAARLFAELIEPTLQASPSRATLSYMTLPSTSPAHATMSREQKLNEWSCIADCLSRDL